MKTNIRNLYLQIAALGMLLTAVNISTAQTTSMSTTTSTTSAGTVREFTPDAFTIATDSSSAPVRYTYSKTTTYVDENGNPVSVETVKSGLPVTVYYERDGDSLVATKVVVRKSVDISPDGSRQTTTTTSTTSSQGTVTAFDPDAIAVRSESSDMPVSYSFTRATTYVDENGNPVAVDTVKTGVPVTIFYDRDGDRMVATRVVVRSVEPNASVIEHKKTTTTTTETNPNP